MTSSSSYLARSRRVGAIVLTAIASTAWLGGCSSVAIIDGESGGAGGGQAAGTGGNGSGGNDSGVLTGRFGEGPVEGLQYESASQSGLTDANGEFRYLAGETVRFSVGSIAIGEALGAALLSPFDLAGITPPSSGPDVRRAVNRLKSHARAIPFDVAINITVLLHTLDDDSDASNGITIPITMHDVAGGKNLNFDTKYPAFVGGFPLRQLIGDARAANVWSGAKVIRTPAYALDSLYAGLGITPIIDGRSLYEYDATGNGSVDKRRFLSHDERGNLSLRESDATANGSVDTRSSYTYDDNGNMWVVETDSLADGTIDARYTFTYDADGNLTQREEDSNADGIVDKGEIYTYDGYGSRVSLQYIGSEFAETYAHDSNGNLTKLERQYEANAPVQYRETYTYDPNGNLTLIERDSGADGNLTNRTVYAYDAHDNRILLEEDFDADGIADFRETFGYDAEGNQILFERDPGATGTVAFSQSDTHDENGNITLTEIGSPDKVNIRWSYGYDANGNRTSLEYDSNADGSPEISYTYSYDGNANISVQEGDGTSSTHAFGYQPSNRWRTALVGP